VVVVVVQTIPVLEQVEVVVLVVVQQIIVELVLVQEIHLL
jgi:hypothetical protein